MLRINFIAAIIATIIFANLSTVLAAKEIPAPTSETSWFWLSSNSKYSKYFASETVRVTKLAKTRDFEIPTEIMAWTKTTYTLDGAKETIRNYGISEILPNPKSLFYSLALLKINPQSRTIQYLREDFYDTTDRLIWSKAEGRVKEVNSQSFDEDFFVAIVDDVFNQGEADRKNAKDRWIELWVSTNKKTGDTTTVTGDTTTMRLKGANLILWQWQENKNSAGQVTEIRFLKKFVNLGQGTERVVSGRVWDAKTRHWSDFDDEYGGSYHMIKNNDPAYKGLVRLRAFAKSNADWIKRYTIP